MRVVCKLARTPNARTGCEFHFLSSLEDIVGRTHAKLIKCQKRYVLMKVVFGSTDLCHGNECFMEIN